MDVGKAVKTVMSMTKSLTRGKAIRGADGAKADQVYTYMADETINALARGIMFP